MEIGKEAEQQQTAEIYVSDRPSLTVDVTPQWTAQFVNGVLRLTDPKQIELMRKYRATAPSSSLSMFKPLDVDNARRVAMEHAATFVKQPSSVQGGFSSTSHEATRAEILGVQNREDLLRGGTHVAGEVDRNDPNFVPTVNVPQPSVAPNPPAAPAVTKPLGTFSFNPKK